MSLKPQQGAIDPARGALDLSYVLYYYESDSIGEGLSAWHLERRQSG